MPTRIRLQRHGKKNQPFYHIVVADGRVPRDGKFIEKLGTYNPLTNPATIELNVERATEWIGMGAQPSDTARRILSYKGVLLKHHLDGGVAKGALTQDVADKKWNDWKAQRDAKIAAKKSNLTLAAVEAAKAAKAAEIKVSEQRAEAIAKKRAEAEAEAAAKAAEAAAETAEEAEVAPEA